MHFRHQRNLQLNGVLHGFPQQGCRLLRLLRRTFQQQFIVYLQDQAAIRTIASLMISAAVPWTGVFIAARLPNSRIGALGERSSGR